MKLLFVHNARKTKVGNQQIGVIFWRSEEEILGLKVAMDDAVVVEIRNC